MCPSCGGKKSIYLDSIDGYQIKKCLRCGLVVTITSEKNRKAYVQEKYSHEYAQNYKVALPKLHKRFSRQITLIKKITSRGKFLDVGCGTGYFLTYLKEYHSQWQIYGVEPSTLLREVASSNVGTRIRRGTLNNIPFPNTYFDIITCYDVLEHSVDLHNNLSELRRVLKPNGLILVQAPNYKSIMAYITGKKWDWWCIPDHVLHFSYDFLTAYFQANGFRILKSYTYEDQEDFLSNIKGVFSRNYITKIMYILLIPLFLIAERIAWITHQGGLTVILAQKN